MVSVMPKLPLEITEQILLRVPARSVLRFKTVCKQWRSLISEPKFVKDHVNCALSDDGILHHGVVGVTRTTSEHCCITSQSIDHQSLNLTEFNFQIEPPVYPRVLVSCNGLLLLDIYFFKKLLLWNPLFREKRNNLPPCNSTSLAYHTRFVLGYASSVDDYKVVVLGSNQWSELLEGEIYSLETNSWRTIPSYNYSSTSTQPTSSPGSVKRGVHVHGSIYWVVSPAYEFILAFDLTTEKFKRIETPPSYSSLVEIRGCLAAYRSYSEIGEVVIWTWKNEEWSKLVTLQKQGGKHILCLCSINNCQFVLLVLKDTSSFTFCDFVICDLECVTPQDILCGTYCRSGLTVHMVETFVSPISGNDGGKFEDS